MQGYRAIEVKSFKNIQIGYRNIFMTALRDNHEIIPILIRLSMASNRKWGGRDGKRTNYVTVFAAKCESIQSVISETVNSPK